MGQQQLLLLVLGVIIVGIAVVAGIGMFNAAAEESVRDELSAQLMAIGANAQQWYKKPTSMGGGNGDLTNWVIPEKMRVTASTLGSIDPQTGVVTGAGYQITTVGGTGQANPAVVTATPREYTWTATATIYPEGIVIGFSDLTPTTP